MLAYSFHYGTVMVGPILNFRRYQEFVNGTLYDRQKHGRDWYVDICLIRLLIVGANLNFLDLIQFSLN